MTNTQITNTTAQTKIETFADSIDALVAKRVLWEQGTYAAANAELYSILGDCLDLYIAVKRSYELPKGLNALLEEKGIGFNASTSLELKLVRLVFATSDNTDKVHNRLFGYARVIRVAADAKETGTTLPKFIADNHGIEEIRRAGKEGVSAAEKQKAQIEQARVQLIEATEDELFSNFEMPNELQPVDGEHFSLALVRKNADGTGSIVYGVNNVAVVNTVLSIAGKTLHEDAVKAMEAETAKQVAAVKQQNMAALRAATAETHNANKPAFAAQVTLPTAEAVLA
jgi:hypothetical protein